MNFNNMEKHMIAQAEKKEHQVKISTTPLRDEERQRCEVWTRVMGYHRPVSSFNIGKKGEYKERVYFRECKTNLR